MAVVAVDSVVSVADGNHSGHDRDRGYDHHLPRLSRGYGELRPAACSLPPSSLAGEARAVMEYAAPAVLAYLGLGSNLGDREAEVAKAIQAIAKLGRVAAVSSFYETEPEGGAAQPRYINAAVRLETELDARRLLGACLAIEASRGRSRPAHRDKAPRTLDIDLLLYGSEVIAEPGLRVPHPALLVRPFVLIPLVDVALPGLCHPESGQPLDRCVPDPTVRRLG